MPLTILTTRTLTGDRANDSLVDAIRTAAGPDADLRFAPAAQVEHHIPDAEVYLAGPFTPPILAAARRLKWVHTSGAGVEGLLFPEFVASPVLLTNARGAHHVAMPEYVLMAMLAWTHHLPALVRAQARREWIHPQADETQGKTLGLLGYGEIGRAIAQRAAPLGLRCLALRRNPQDTRGADLVERTYAPHDLPAFLAECDFVVNSLPLTPETHGLIGAAELRAMRPTAVLIHLGRGPTVQSDALLAALRDHTIAGAFLDVFDREPLPSDSPLWDLDNAIITSHTSGNSVHYLERSIAIFCDNLRRYRANQPLRNLVDKHLGY